MYNTPYMKALRTRFKRDIVAEFLPPARESSADRVIIICGGMPSVPKHQALLDFFSKKGFWVFYPRYRGSWESNGSFLEISPEKDILDIISELPKGFISMLDKKRYRVNPQQIFLFGASFGGPAALLASRDPRVTKVVAFAPVVDWKAPSKAEPLDFVERYTRDAFGNAYRITSKNWHKLKGGVFYNPVAHASSIQGRKIFIIHAKNDLSVPWSSVARFAKKVKCEFLLLKDGGHLSASNFMNPKFYRRISSFLRGRI